MSRTSRHRGPARRATPRSAARLAAATASHHCAGSCSCRAPVAHAAQRQRRRARRPPRPPRRPSPARSAFRRRGRAIALQEPLQVQAFVFEFRRPLLASPARRRAGGASIAALGLRPRPDADDRLPSPTSPHLRAGAQRRSGRDAARDRRRRRPLQQDQRQAEPGRRAARLRRRGVGQDPRVLGRARDRAAPPARGPGRRGRPGRRSSTASSARSRRLATASPGSSPASTRRPTRCARTC